MNKAELLNWWQEKSQQWQGLLDQLDPARIEQPGMAGHWSVKDMVAHLTGWQRRLTARLQAAQRGEAEPPPPWPAQLQTDDAINAWIYDTNRQRPVRDILEESRQALQQFFTVLERLPDDVQVDSEPPFILVWVGGERIWISEFFDHFRDDHESDMRAWLARTAPPS